MTQWKINTDNDITVITELNVNLEAYYTLESSTSNSYNFINVSFVQYGDRYVLSHNFSALGTYYLKIIDTNNNLDDLIAKIEVVERLDVEKLENVENQVETLVPSIWTYTNRLLTDNSADIVSINGVPVTNINDFHTDLSSVIAEFGDIATDVWSATTRELTQAVPVDVSGIWTHPDRSLTDTDMNIVTVNDIIITDLEDFKSQITPQQIWEYATRTVQTTNEITPTDIWTYGSRSLTAMVDAKIVQVQNDIVTGLDDFKATISEVDLSNIATDVWTYANRNITNENTITPADIWTYATRNLTDKTADITHVNGIPVTISDFQADTVNIDLTGVASDVWNYNIRNLTAYETDVNIISVNGIGVANIDDFKTDTTDIESSLLSMPSNVWNYTTRDITNTNTLSANDVWTFGTRDLTNTDSNIISVNGIATLGINDFKATEVTIDTSLLAQDVWSYSTRDLTDYGSQLSASDVWTYATRYLTDKTVDVTMVNGSLVSINDFKADVSNIDTMSQDVWSYHTRDLTQNLNIPSTSDIWGYTNRSLTNNDMNITKVNGTIVTNIDEFKSDLSLLESQVAQLPDTVWEYHTRSLTDKDANITKVNGVNITIDDFKADVSALTSESLITDFLNTDVNTYNLNNTLGAMFKRIEYLNAFIYVDTEVLVNGDGSQQHPFDNINDAKDYVELTGINNIKLSGSIIVTHNLKNMNIIGIGLPIIDLNNQDMKNTKFTNVQLQGNYTNTIVAYDSVLLDGFRLNGFFDKCALDGDLICDSSTKVLLSGCYSNIPGLGRPTISMNSGVATQLSVRGYSGGLTIKDSDHIDDTCTIEIAQGSLTFDASNVLGVMVARGLGIFVNDVNGATVIDEMENKFKIAEQTWIETNRTLTEDVTISSVFTDHLMTLENYDDTVINTKLDDKPNLTEIESSTILAKKSDVTVIENIVNSLPILSEMRDEMINIQFGGLEIANNQMTIKDKNGVVIAIFNLFDNQGNPTMHAVYKRVVV